MIAKLPASRKGDKKMNCPVCQGTWELAPSKLFARCPACKSLFMNVAGNWQPYPVDENMRGLIEQSLGFATSTDESAK
jgi:hypothetical protein